MRLLALAALAAGGFASAASAQNLKPGLWEITNDVKGGGTDASMAQLQQHMKSMSPQQRKLMEDMMAKQGMKMGPGGAGGISVRTCLTKEMVERNELPSQQGDCKTTKQQRSGNTMKFAVTCTRPPSSGEGQVTIQSPEAYTMRMSLNSQMGGKPHTTNMEMAGKWLSADCGSVKPMQPPMKK